MLPDSSMKVQKDVFDNLSCLYEMLIRVFIGKDINKGLCFFGMHL